MLCLKQILLIRQVVALRQVDPNHTKTIVLSPICEITVRIQDWFSQQCYYCQQYQNVFWLYLRLVSLRKLPLRIFVTLLVRHVVR